MKLPVYAHPTMTVLVDDSDTFLHSLVFQLDPMQASVCFHDPLQALEWFKTNAQSSELPLQVDFDNPNQSAEQRNVAVDLEQIYRISGQRQRFSIPSVLVVDYSMPQMNGVAFCQAIQHLPCKKILFTGQADEKIAVDAFNRGLIDRYIKKSADDALDRLEEEVAALQKAFFQEQSETLLDMLVLHEFSFLRCGALAKVVQQLYQEHGFVEHYPFPSPSGILFFKADGSAQLMVVETQRGYESQVEMARDSGAPQSLVEALEEKRMLPFFPPDGMYSDEVGQHWHRYCKAPQVCKGLETYYWALFEVDPALLDIQPTPYAEFLRQHTPPLAA
ncbi:Response regulator receiver domain-containing protein [Duganella sp. CF458]|uniref:response regulator n=1 Tax=Duganella sp. CF458 TaxID=1884368 RepID=UPI0008EB33D4|nr:response regulator [Duganella sp. CF458]SFG58689.1 Response regulator receiver domain-containing protein [Duganella sp. CF458]